MVLIGCFLVRKMIQSKLIKSEQLLLIYRDHYHHLAKNNIDLEYFKSSKVRIFFRDNEENMLAGYCINSGPNYRTFLPLNEDKLQNLTSTHGFDKRTPHEVTCLWIEPNSRHSKWSVFIFYKMFLDVLSLKHGSLIFGTHGKNVKNFFILAFPNIIFYEKLFVTTKAQECDFWIMKGSKFTFFKCLIFLGSIKLLFGNKTLTRLRLWLGKKGLDSKN